MACVLATKLNRMDHLFAQLCSAVYTTSANTIYYLTSTSRTTYHVWLLRFISALALQPHNDSGLNCSLMERCCRPNCCRVYDNWTQSFSCLSPELGISTILFAEWNLIDWLICLWVAVGKLVITDHPSHRLTLHSTKTKAKKKEKKLNTALCNSGSNTALYRLTKFKDSQNSRICCFGHLQLQLYQFLMRRLSSQILQHLKTRSIDQLWRLSCLDIF